MNKFCRYLKLAFSDKGSAAIVIILLLIFSLGVFALGYVLGNKANFFQDRKIQEAETLLSSSSGTEPKFQDLAVLEEKNLDLKKEASPSSAPSLLPSLTPLPTKIEPTVKPAEPESAKSNIRLNLTVASDEPGKAKLSWTVEGGTVLNGFKTVYAKDPNPSYPKDTWHYLNPDKREDAFKDLPSGQTLHFRVGVYVGGETGADPYSNDVAVTIK